MISDSDNIIDLYERTAKAWDAERHRSRFDGERQWIKRFADLVKPGARILDVGCGSGKPIVPDLLSAGLAVTGVDAAPSMITLCQQRFPHQEWLIADMRTLNLGQRFGGLLAWHSFFHLPAEDQERMFPIFAAHTEPAAPLMFTSGPERGVNVGSWQGEPLYHASLDEREYRALLETNGFDVLTHIREDATCGGATVWIAKRRDDESRRLMC